MTEVIDKVNEYSPEILKEKNVQNVLMANYQLNLL